MDSKFKAYELCEKLGITEERERNYFIMGYQHGVMDAKLEVIKDITEAFTAKDQTIPHEIR